MENRMIDDNSALLNHSDRDTRLTALRACREEALHSGGLPALGEDVNNHIHTTYSFSPYSPSMAVWKARMAGLSTAGIMDHDSYAGAEEFRMAGAVMGLAVTCGIEIRVRLDGTPYEGKRLNNPDQSSVAYMTLHGIASTQTEKVRAFLDPIGRARDARNRRMTDNLNDLLKPCGLQIDYDRDVLPLSMQAAGGSVTERHLMFALARAVLVRYDKGEALIPFLTCDLCLDVPAKARAFLLAADNPHRDYDLLNLLKASCIPRIYTDADAECPHIEEVIAFAAEIGAICAYPYLGDVGDSVTGDKRAQAFEDAFLDALIADLARWGIHAVSYMPSRNTMAQLLRLKGLCAKHRMLEISGEDINSPRQPFICLAARDPAFRNLADATWAMIGHEYMAGQSTENAFFARQTQTRFPDLEERIAYFRDIGKRCTQNCNMGTEQ